MSRMEATIFMTQHEKKNGVNAKNRAAMKVSQSFGEIKRKHESCRVLKCTPEELVLGVLL
jgi:hypothetical protein